jgi:hypothetical protein
MAPPSLAVSRTSRPPKLWPAVRLRPRPRAERSPRLDAAGSGAEANGAAAAAHVARGVSWTNICRANIDGYRQNLDRSRFTNDCWFLVGFLICATPCHRTKPSHAAVVAAGGLPSGFVGVG